MDNVFVLGFELMWYGLLGVFTTLIIFILMIIGLTKVFPYKED